MDVLDVTGSTVIVTGASSGIGAATARLLHQAGAHPVLAARRADRLAVLSEELDGALAVPTDVTDPTAVRRLAETTLDRHGRIDGLVNNAGVSLHTPLDRLDLDEFARVLQLNVISLVAMTQAVLPAMRARRSGRIVNISSGTTRPGWRCPASARTPPPRPPSTCSRRSPAESSRRTASPCRSCCRRSRQPSSAAAATSPVSSRGRAWSRTARSTSARSSCARCGPARSASTSRTAQNSRSSPRCRIADGCCGPDRHIWPEPGQLIVPRPDRPLPTARAESPGRGRALRRQLGGYGGEGSPNDVNQRRADCAVSLDSDASRGPLGGIRKVDVQGVPRRSVHRVAVVDRRGAKREPAVASVAAARDRRLLGGVGAHASLQVLSGGEAAGEEVAPAGLRRAKYGGERYSGQEVGGSLGAGGGAQHVLPPERLVAAGRGTPGRAGLPARARRAGHRVRGGACPWPAQRRRGGLFRRVRRRTSVVCGKAGQRGGRRRDGCQRRERSKPWEVTRQRRARLASLRWCG